MVTRGQHALRALVPGSDRAAPTGATSRSAATPATRVTGPTHPRCTTPRPIPGRCCRTSTPRRSTSRSTRSPTSSRTATCSRSAHRRTSSFLLNVQNQTWTPVGGASGITNGSSVMYRPGKILYSGGTTTQDSSSPAHATTAVIDLNAQTPAWRQTAPMSNARIYHTLTMLADGTVLAVGGETTWGQTGQTEVSGGVLPSEIWNPDTETWSPAAPTGTTRGYHSTAILMPDGTVLIGGSGHANPGLAAQTTSQIYSPPYLFKGPSAHHRVGSCSRDVWLDDPGVDSGRRLDQRGQPRLARLRHPSVRHGPALRAAQLHARARAGSTSRSRPRRRPLLRATTCCSS